MNDQQFEQLLYEEESTTLDFKKEQYRFAKATEEEKSELLKDILGFANAWRRSEAYILIGVEDVRGGRGNVLGIAATDHLDDHSLQQFVNGPTNRPVRFHYEAFGLEGKQVGIIRIDKQQARPIFLKRDYGKLKQEAVYVRRGSSTDPTKPARPDEIAMMGRNSETDLVPELNGLSSEIQYNQRLSVALSGTFQLYIQMYGLGTNVSKPSPVPPQRFRLQAFAAHLQRPVLTDHLPLNEVEAYWEKVSLCNAMMDRVIGLTTVAVVDDVVETVLRLIPELSSIATTIAGGIRVVLEAQPRQFSSNS